MRRPDGGVSRPSADTHVFFVLFYLKTCPPGVSPAECCLGAMNKYDNIPYYVEWEQDKTFGPYSVFQLRTLRLLPDTLVRRGDEMATAASMLPELEGFLLDDVKIDASELDRKHYWVRDEGKTRGPYTLLELSLFPDLSPNDMVSTDGSNWVKASQIDGLTAVVAMLKGIVTPPIGVDVKRLASQLAEVAKPPRYALADKESEKAYYKEEYVSGLALIKSLLPRLSDAATMLMSERDSALAQLDIELSERHHEAILQREQEKSATRQSVEEEIAKLRKSMLSTDVQEKLIVAMRTDAEHAIVTAEANSMRAMSTVSQNINQRRSEINQLFEQRVGQLRQAAGDAVARLTTTESHLWDSNALTALPTSDAILSDGLIYPGLDGEMLLGRQNISYPMMDGQVMVPEREFIPFWNAKHLIVKGSEDLAQAMAIASAIVARSLLSCSGISQLMVHMVDTIDFEGTGRILNSLEKGCYELVTDGVALRQLLSALRDRVAHVKNEFLKYPTQSLHEYNARGGDEPFHLLVLKNFAADMNPELANLLKSILRNGVEAGVQVIMVTDQHLSGDTCPREVEVLRPELAAHCATIDVDKLSLSDATMDEKVLQGVVDRVNEGLNRSKRRVLPLAEFMPESDRWWTGVSAESVSIPFGRVGGRKEHALTISTIAKGQNAAVIIGVMRSGKSVFLHDIILSAAMHYSPDELEMYLIDFSGVEFDVYAKHHLPHARIIAPESEREFGLSVLRRLKDEATRREEIFREKGVVNLAQLRKRYPTVRMPRVLVIVDEFQKFFSDDNDAISREAGSLIQAIVKEYGKFGLNLILATQELFSQSREVCNLIANRVAFNCKPVDYEALIPRSQRPNLEQGVCVSTNDYGSPVSNAQVQCYFADEETRQRLVERIAERYEQSSIKLEPAPIVFRGDELPEFEPNLTPSDLPTMSPVLLGQSIAISDTDVTAYLPHQRGGNLLVIGGEQDVAQCITYYAFRSLLAAHSDGSAKFHLFNYMRENKELSQRLDADRDAFAGVFEITIADASAPGDEAVQRLVAVREAIERRKAAQESSSHLFVIIFGAQDGMIFEPVMKIHFSKQTNEPSEATTALEYIVANGPSVGVHTIVQVDSLGNLRRVLPGLGTGMEDFGYRAILQMSEGDSRKLTNTPYASRLGDNRAYLFDLRRNTFEKFKPYKYQ